MPKGQNSLSARVADGEWQDVPFTPKKVKQNSKPTLVQRTPAPDFIPDTSSAPDFIPDTTGDWEDVKTNKGNQSDALTAFNGLPLAEKHKVLLATNPDYAALPGGEQVKALNSIHYGAPPDQGWRNNLADRIEQGRGAVERGVTSAMQDFGLPTNYAESQHFLGRDPGQKPAIEEMWDAHMAAGEKSPVGYVPLLGPTVVRASEHAQAGQYPEMIGDITAGVATLAPFRGPAGKVTGALSDRVAATMRTPEGELGPITKGVARVGGGVGGATIGYNMTPGGVPKYYGTAAGAYSGRELGPLLADRIIPKLAPKSPTPFKGSDWTPPPEPSGAAAGTTEPLSGVMRVPVPRSPFPGENPNYMASVPREELPAMAARGKPGAATQQQQLGQPVIYTPETGYAPPKSVTNLSGFSTPPRPSRSLSERMPPSESPSLSQRTGYTPSEKAATMSEQPRNLGPEFDAQQREEMIGRYKGILRHPAATAEDMAEATARLRELGAVQ